MGPEKPAAHSYPHWPALQVGWLCSNTCGHFAPQAPQLSGSRERSASTQPARPSGLPPPAASTPASASAQPSPHAPSRHKPSHLILPPLYGAPVRAFRASPRARDYFFLRGFSDGGVMNPCASLSRALSTACDSASASASCLSCATSRSSGFPLNSVADEDSPSPPSAITWLGIEMPMMEARTVACTCRYRRPGRGGKISVPTCVRRTNTL